MVYRKWLHSDTWHCCRNCRYWPDGKGKYVERNSKPVSGQLCDRCQTKMREGDCTPLATILFLPSRAG
jgi:hypothetical protein